jgi:hypothetical protein
MFIVTILENSFIVLRNSDMWPFLFPQLREFVIAMQNNIK